MEKIAITGGSGLLGRALLARLYETATLTVFSRSEKAQLDLRREYPNVRFLVGDVLDRVFLRRTFDGQDFVIHAAALKHVDISEREPTAYVKVNVVGSLNVAEIAHSLGIRAVGISTDKACEPVNVYGLTKLLMERIFTEHGHVCVRYGNVLGSDGSVLGLWRRQWQGDGTISLTDPEMTRFLFPVSEAVDEVLWAMHNAQPGTVVVPRLRAVTMRGLAVAFLVASGHDKIAPRDIAVIGPRPGEKKHEALLSQRESRWADRQGKRYLLHANGSGDETSAYTSDCAEALALAELRGYLQAEAE